MKKMIKTLIAASALIPTLVLADIAVIVNNANANATLENDVIAKIFLGKAKSFPDGTKAIPLDQDEGAATRNNFYQTIANKDAGQIKSYWSRLIFAGKGTPPKAVGSDADVVSLVSSNPNMVGYVDAGTVNDSVKVVATLK
jgi:ABC-type phosphate transport system substrate-binding protein